MFIKASQKSKLIRKRQSVIDKYNTQKAKYEEEYIKYKSDYDTYTSRMAVSIGELLADELRALPFPAIEVKRNSYNEYSISIFNKKNPNMPYKTGGSYSIGNDRGEYKGISWCLYIYFIKDLEGNVTVSKDPRIFVDKINSDDLPVLQATYNLFSKVDTIDWQSILTKLSNDVPKKEDYVTTQDPGYLDTREYDEKIKNYDISRIVGKDLWVKVNIRREDSYDRWSSYCNAPGVDGRGWVKVLSESDKFYTFNWLDLGNGSNDEFKPEYIEKQLRKKYRLKKIYFDTIKPIEYLTTEDLTAEA